MLRYHWRYWQIAIITLIGRPVASISYYTLLLQSGVLPPKADSIGIPIGSDFLLAIALAPIVLTVTGFVHRGYDGTAQILGWNARRPMQSALVTIGFGLPAALITVALIFDTTTVLRTPEWWGLVWSVKAIPIIAWLVVIQAVLVSLRVSVTSLVESRP